MALITRATLRTKVRERADQENSSFCSDAELNRYINDSISRLLDLVYHQDSDVLLFDVTPTASGVEHLVLPSDFYELKGVDHQTGTSTWETVEPFSFKERNNASSSWMGNVSGYEYRIHGNLLKLMPTPPAGQVFKIWYLPSFTGLTDEAMTFDFKNGWDEWVVLDCAIKCLLKQDDQDMASSLASERQRVEDIIKNAARRRDSNAPYYLADPNIPEGGFF